MVFMNEHAAHSTPVSGTASGLDGTRAQDATTSARSQSQLDAKQQEQPRILVVEDDRALAALEADMLSAHGYAVSIADTGEHAIIALQRAIPDLVVLDLELTGMVQGWEVLQRLRTRTAIPVLITSSSADAVRAHMHHTGESRLTLDHLPKPYPLQVLLKRVNRMLPAPPN